MKKLVIVLILLSSISAYSQDATNSDLENRLKPITEQLKTVQSENRKLKIEIDKLNARLSSTTTTIDSLGSLTEANIRAINETNSELGSKISTTETSTNQKITAIDASLSKKSLYGIIGVLSAILLSGLIYWMLTRRQKSDKTALIEQLTATKSSIEESLVRELGKQTEFIDTSLQLMEKQKSSNHAAPTIEPDHSLALKVASEINLIERNINLMDSKTRGLKQLQASVGKLKDNLSANGYEMPVLLGKPFNQGMRVIVTSSIPDDSLEHGSEIISKILIPQVNYNDKMIQTAQIEVSVG